MLKRAVVFHAPRSEGAAAFANQLAQELERRGVACTIADVWGPPPTAAIQSASVVICVGGDGTVLRAEPGDGARTASPSLA